MRKRAAILTVLALALAGCVPQQPRPINSLAFERRPPLPGQPGYLETIHYIYQGVHYISPSAGFLVSDIGDLCFQGALVPGFPAVTIPNNFWCISPFNVDRVEAIENNVTYIDQIRLWCRLGAAQCAYKIGYPNIMDHLWAANSITAETVPSLRQRDAIEYLIYLMGGNVSRDVAAR
jgi:hypothetical protein